MSRGKNRFDGVSGTDREGALFDNDGVAVGASGHLASRGFYPSEITGLAGPHTLRLGGRIHGQKDHVRFGDGDVDFRREVKVSPSASTDNLVQSGFIDRELGEIWVIPRINARLVEVNDRDLDLRTSICNHRHGGAAHIPSANAADVADHESLEPTMSLWEKGVGSDDNC